jgi:response regulator receiver domain-containing protein
MMGTHASAAARVLIVEDDAVFRGPLRATLAAEGYTVVAVASAEAAESVLDHEAVDVVLSDLGLPGMEWRGAGRPAPEDPVRVDDRLTPRPRFQRGAAAFGDGPSREAVRRAASLRCAPRGCGGRGRDPEAIGP